MNYPLQYFNYQNGTLSSGDISLAEIIQELGTPLYVYSSDAFLSNIEAFKKGLQGLDALICFAMKSNSNLSILRMLSEAETGMDVVSGGELYRAQKANVSGKKIIFSGVGKSKDEMKIGLTYGGEGIYSFNTESIPELLSLNQVATELGRKAPVALRFNPDVDPKTHPYISTGIKKNKFGMHETEILKFVGELSSLPGIDLKGISIHIGSQLLSLSPIEEAFSKLATLVQKLKNEFNRDLEFVDLGGGLGITYLDEKPPEIEDYCQLVKKYFGMNSPFHGKLKIVLEPGRHLSGNAGILLTQVIYRKERKQHDFLIVDAAMNDLMRPALYESYHEIIPIQEQLNSGVKRKTHIVGPVCESSDCFGKNRLLSKDLKEGDYLAILSAGAYGFSMASQYNSRPRPPEVLIHQGKVQVIRKREQYEDLICGEEG
jgi:diaminopimelate decarboxylase